jgi:toxin ParE1/3/4
MKVRFAPSARRDLLAIGDYIASRNPDRAESFVEELVEACNALGNHPERYAVVPRYRNLGIRSRSYARYLIFYRINDVGVGIMRVVHGMRDLTDLDLGND